MLHDRLGSFSPGLHCSEAGSASEQYTDEVIGFTALENTTAVEQTVVNYAMLGNLVDSYPARSAALVIVIVRKTNFPDEAGPGELIIQVSVQGHIQQTLLPYQLSSWLRLSTNIL